MTRCYKCGSTNVEVRQVKRQNKTYGEHNTCRDCRAQRYIPAKG